jgi:hypothetical protein
VYDCGTDKTVSEISSYVTQTGAVTGDFQMAILIPISSNQAQVIAITNIVTSITAGIFVLLLTAPVTLMADTSYYLAVYNQVNASTIGGISAGVPITGAPPINFRVQNLTGFTLGQIVSTGDVSLNLTPWLCAC